MKFALKDLKNSARSARRQIGQTLDRSLLGLQHSKISRWATELKDRTGLVEGSDLIGRIGQNVFERAQAVRASMTGTFCADEGRPRRKVSKKPARAVQKVSGAKAATKRKKSAGAVHTTKKTTKKKATR